MFYQVAKEGLVIDLFPGCNHWAGWSLGCKMYVRDPPLWSEGEDAGFGEREAATLQAWQSRSRPGGGSGGRIALSIVSCPLLCPGCGMPQLGLAALCSGGRRWILLTPRLSLSTPPHEGSEPVRPWSGRWVTHLSVYTGLLSSWISGIFCDDILLIVIIVSAYQL